MGSDSKINKILIHYVLLMRNIVDSRELEENTHSEIYGRALLIVNKINLKTTNITEM